MKSTGIVRKMDELGRIVLPMEIRNRFDINPRDPLEIFVDGTSIVLRKYEPSCVFCQSVKDNIIFEDKRVCKACIEKLAKEK